MLLQTVIANVYVSSKTESRAFRHEQRNYVKNKNHLERDIICIGDIDLISSNTPQMKWKYWLVEELIRGNERKIRGACALIKNKDSKGITQRPVNKFYKLESSQSKTTVQLKFIDENENKKVTSAKWPVDGECNIWLERHNYSYNYCIIICIRFIWTYK